MLNQIDKQDIHRITSGQVIIDLVSIIKELVENSIDAKSNTIEVNFKEYGLAGLEVNDNGYGISPEDYEAVCLKNYTSKISKFEDLESVKTLGFRGEALSAINSVADMNIITSTSDELPKSKELKFDTLGRLIKVEEKINQRTERGTKVEVSNIFKDLPVRYKNFAKTIKREFTKLIGFLNNYILINSNIKFIINNFVDNKKKNLIVTKGNNTILENYITLFGYQSSDSLKPITIDHDEFKLEGYISNISIQNSRNIKDRQFLFINNRPILSKGMLRLINDSFNNYNQLIPSFVINIILDESRLDINLTPNKLQVNIIRERDLFQELEHQLNEWFTNQNQNQTIKVSKTKKDHQQTVSELFKPRTSYGKRERGKSLGNDDQDDLEIDPIYNYKQKITFKRLKPNSINASKASNHNNNDNNDNSITQSSSMVNNEITVNKLQFNLMKLIGQFNLGFMITRIDNDLFIIDQHASDEIYNFEKLKNEFKITNQLLIKPIKLDLSLVDRLKLEEFKSIIELNGFKYTIDNNNNQVYLNYMPYYKAINFKVDDLYELLTNLPHTPILSKINSILAMRACRKSIMIGRSLTTSTMKSVINHLSSLDKPWNCPHGRPTLRYLLQLNNSNSHFNLDYTLSTSPPRNHCAHN